MISELPFLNFQVNGGRDRFSIKKRDQKKYVPNPGSQPFTSPNDYTGNPRQFNSLSILSTIWGEALTDPYRGILHWKDHCSRISPCFVQ